MIQRITRLPTLPKAARKKRVAAYARVSSGKDAMLHSLASQVSHYSALIQSHPDWEYAGVYSDEAFTGTKAERPGFKGLLAAARSGSVDIVLTKSVSRFARNTVDLLKTVRELAALGVDVRFEEQGISSMSPDGELMLTLLASVAQEESRSVSENVKWRVRRDFANGRPTYQRPLGYKLINLVFTVVPEEAKVVREIFRRCIAGEGVLRISKALNEEGVPTICGRPWGPGNVRSILRNRAYTGELTLQKTYRLDHVSKKKTKNKGELPMYVIEHDHEPIVSLGEFTAAQEAMEKRLCAPKGRPRTKYPFTGLIKCGVCGSGYDRRTLKGHVHWRCRTIDRVGKCGCASRQIPQQALDAAVPSLEGVRGIVALPGERLRIEFEDGHTEERRWTPPSRRDSWTPEMKEAARKRSIECAKRRKKNG